MIAFKPWTLAMLICCLTSDAAGAYPMQIVQQGMMMQSRRDIRQILPAYSSYLKGYWQFEGNYNDASGNSSTPTPHNSATMVTNGHVGQALSLNSSTSDYLDFASPFLSSATDLSVSVWVKTSDGSSLMSIFAVGPTTGCSPSGGGIFLKDGKPQTVIGCGTWLSSSASYQTGIWNHIVFTRDSSKKSSIYLNGNLVAGPLDNTGGRSLSATTQQIGFTWSSNSKIDFFNGQIDELAVWSGVVLTTADISALYQQN